MDAWVVYEQWGWPLPEPALAETLEAADTRPVVLDRVDSAHAYHLPGPGSTWEVTSLAKTLGLDGGGLLRHRGAFVPFEPEPASNATLRLAEHLAGNVTPQSRVHQDYFKTRAQAVNPTALRWLATHDALAALDHERLTRNRHARLVAASPFATGWPDWMHAGLGAGAGPGLAPLLRGADASVLRAAMARLGTRWGVESSIQPFNWSGHPLRPQFEPCLVLPVHAQVVDLEALLADLESLAIKRPPSGALSA